MSSLGREAARAKVNLNLHITGRDAEGYHRLETLMVLADGAEDVVTLAGVAESDRIDIGGPFAGKLDGDDDNLVLAATRLVRDARPDLPPLAWTLEKNLPVAAGIGGGSADAGAALRLMARVFDVSQRSLQSIAGHLGADVPFAFGDRAGWATARGDRIEPVAVPTVAGLLVNAGDACSTPAVFGAYRSGKDPFSRTIGGPVVSNADGLLDWCVGTRNDLLDAAVSVAPVIEQVLSALQSLEACRLARMSGSGATCFGLFDTTADAEAAAIALREREPTWWVTPVALS